MSERLRDDDAPWGKTRAQFAFEHAKQCREAERRRRESYRASMLAREPGSIFDTIFVPIAAAGAYDEDWHLRVDQREDTRDTTGRLLGDPVPGRSALDLRRAR